MSTSTRQLSAYDSQSHRLSIRVPAELGGALVAAKAFDAVTTVLALLLAPTLLYESQPFVAPLTSPAAVLVGVTAIAVLAVAVVVAMAELSGLVLEAARRHLGLSGRWRHLPSGFRVAVYCFSITIFAAFGISNLWVLTTSMGVVA